MNILNYQESLLNPALKLLTVALLVIGTTYFLLVRMNYGGELKKIATLMTIAGVVGIVSATSRFIGDFMLLWKWSESIFMLSFAMVSFFVGYLVLTLFRRMDFPE